MVDEVFKVAQKACNECLFSKNKIVPDERKNQLLEEILSHDQFFICHKASIAEQTVCCRGFWDRYKNDILPTRLAQFFNIVQEIDVMTLEKPVSPFASEGSPYPLLTDWYYGRLDQEWHKEIAAWPDTSIRMSRIGELAAAKIAVLLVEEYERLEADVHERVQEHEGDDMYADDFTNFYDELQDDSFKKPSRSFRSILQDLSKTRTMILDEREFMEKRQGEQK